MAKKNQYVEKTVNYKVVYRDLKGASRKETTFFTASLPNVKSLAKMLNAFARKNPNLEVLACYIVNNEGIFIGTVKFLDAEYAAQKWLTGWKERLLAVALANGYDLKWNTGLTKKEKRSDV